MIFFFLFFKTSKHFFSFFSFNFHNFFQLSYTIINRFFFQKEFRENLKTTCHDNRISQFDISFLSDRFAKNVQIMMKVKRIIMRMF